MTAYEQLRAHIHPSRTLREDPPALPGELELQALWFAGAFGREFQTTDGRAVVIRQFGEWNRSAGPDFLHAAITIDGEDHQGPLELDTHPADWEGHGHATNPAFRDVVLHVVFLDGHRRHFSRSDEGREIPQVIIPADQLDSALGPGLSPPALSHPGRCSTPLAGTPAARVHDLLEQAARFRLEHKARTLQRSEDTHGFEETLWQALARALGYGPNKLAMHLLSQRLPRRTLKLARTHRTREAILFGFSGFLSPDLHRKAPPDSQRYLETLWRDWWRVRQRHEVDPSRSLPWQMHGARPANHPHRRIGSLAAISSIWPSVATPAQRPSAVRMRRLATRLEALDHPYWSRHYTLQSHPAKSPVRLMGKSRVNEFLANYYIPSWHRTAATTAWQAYTSLPAGTTSDPVRRAAIRLFGKRTDQKQFLRRLWQHQALLQIYRDFCLEDASACDDCPFPEQLAQW